MSLETWKAAYYPTPAEDTTPEDALEQTTLKWEGLQSKHLKAHGLFKEGHFIREEGTNAILPLNDASCALCQCFRSDECLHCPLSRTLEGRTCFDGARSPYGTFLYNGDSSLMRSALRDSVQFDTPKTWEAAVRLNGDKF